MWRQIIRYDCGVVRPFSTLSMQRTNRGTDTHARMLDKHFASIRTATRISVLTAIYSKRLKADDDVAMYVDDLEGLFAKLETVGEDTNISEAHKAPLLLASMGKNSALESTFAALRTPRIRTSSLEKQCPPI